MTVRYDFGSQGWQVRSHAGRKASLRANLQAMIGTLKSTDKKLAIRLLSVFVVLHDTISGDVRINPDGLALA
jgi:hypothetical protein